MIVTAVLTAVVVWLLFYGTVATLPLGMICAAAGAGLAALGRHSHDGVLSIDIIAQRSRLCSVNPALKVCGCVGLLIFCVAADSVPVGVGLALAMLLLTVAAGGLPLHDYLALLALPAAFMLVSGLALLFSWEKSPVGVINLPLAGGWLSVTAAAQVRTLLVMAKALGAVSCLYLLSLSTPMTDIINVLRRARVPAVVVELMYLIYRYIFILLNMHRTMRDAAESRLGYDSYRQSLRTTGQIYGNLLALSFRKAGACFDAMESRCYDGEIRFLEQAKPLRPLHILTAAGLALLAAGLLFAGGRM
ncbi:cobalt ECF transporter T component CbiQ [Bacilliculturomica massiliensis]|uniref:cobalt ECF transporter T component CbiQ n=1 Tax=Bacilliculturomica massiliensis TaxID=1917867 RepID=UPI0010313FC6|nr:cobalt ECF transporter T component CbiQ [Bacilliculturomica massiliensis]